MYFSRPIDSYINDSNKATIIVCDDDEVNEALRAQTNDHFTSSDLAQNFVLSLETFTRIRIPNHRPQSVRQQCTAAGSSHSRFWNKFMAKNLQAASTIE